MIKLPFGTKGIWHKPASENTKARDMEAVVLEQFDSGIIYLFTKKPITRGYDTLTNRTVTIFPSDFTPHKKQ